MAALPADGLTPEARAAFAVLRERFRAGLAGRWTEIEQAGDRAALRAALHRLAGAAGGYGFDDVGRAARAAEQLAATGADPALARALDALRIAIQATRAP